jgi:predicted ATPase
MSHLRAVRIRNFKAIRDSHTIKLGALTVFIGNNGAGKSSIIEALQLYQTVVLNGVDAAFEPLGGIQHVRHKESRNLNAQALAHGSLQTDPIRIFCRGHVKSFGVFRARMQLNMLPDERPYIQEEYVHTAAFEETRDVDAYAKEVGEGRSMVSLLDQTRPLYHSVERWQFVSLSPDLMGSAKPQQRVRGKVPLRRDGSNLGGFVLDLATRAPDAFNGIVDAMRFVLPYVQDMRPVMPSADIDRRVYLELKERGFPVPGWLFSSGTLRMLAILCLLRDPDPPPVIFIEELENGLDPRTIGLLVEEIRRAIQSKRTQVIATTHSPYLLDQLLFEHVVVVERNSTGVPEFWRPDDETSLSNWRDEFTIGQIYTMGQLHRVSKPRARRAEGGT